VNGTRSHHVLRCEGDTFHRYEQALLEEEPLLIRVEGQPYAVIMRTPGEERRHARQTGGLLVFCGEERFKGRCHARSS